MHSTQPHRTPCPKYRIHYHYTAHIIRHLLMPLSLPLPLPFLLLLLACYHSHLCTHCECTVIKPALCTIHTSHWNTLNTANCQCVFSPLCRVSARGVWSTHHTHIYAIYISVQSLCEEMLRICVSVGVCTYFPNRVVLNVRVWVYFSQVSICIDGSMCAYVLCVARVHIYLVSI